jgi:hypothetical protein
MKMQQTDARDNAVSCSLQRLTDLICRSLHNKGGCGRHSRHGKHDRQRVAHPVLVFLPAGCASRGTATSGLPPRFHGAMGKSLSGRRTEFRC